MWQRLKWSDSGKYFSQGIAFAILFFISIAGWNLLLTVLVGLGFIIGLVIGSVLLFLAMGFLNSVIATYLWFDVKNEFWSLLAHGFVLFLVLFPLDVILITVPALAFPGLATTAVAIVVSALANGFVAKRVAAYWKQENRAGKTDTEAETP